MMERSLRCQMNFTWSLIQSCKRLVADFGEQASFHFDEVTGGERGLFISLYKGRRRNEANVGAVRYNCAEAKKACFSVVYGRIGSSKSN
jgi:hypothetical protein